MKAWLYYRLSRDEDEEMNSLQNQRQILVDYAEQNGHEVVGESFDDNVSSMTFPMSVYLLSGEENPHVDSVHLRVLRSRCDRFLI